uniref:D5-like helicase-primase n=1 Tax=Pithovirus LCDPAC01 TaxID=2506600 RepID=A0A481YQM9_9VIRU|nr:MAG: D5-like helicase-primase [Pithovirus LCDPAC01]
MSLSLLIQDSIDSGNYKYFDHETGFKFSPNNVKFWITYMNTVKDGGKVSVYERNDGPVQLSFDVSIKLEEITSDTIEYVDKFIRQIIITVKGVITTMIESGSDSEGNCFYLRRSRSPFVILDSGELKFDAKLVFPGCILTTCHSKLLYRRMIMTLMIQKISIPELKLDLSNTIGSIVALTDPKLRLLYLSSIEGEGLSIQSIVSDKEYKLSDVFHPQNHKDFLEYDIDIKEFKYYVPLLFSKGYLHKHISRIKEPSIDGKKLNHIEPTDSPLIQVKAMIHLISPRRAAIKHDWLDIGASIKASDFEIPERDKIKLWKKFTKLKDKFSEDQCENEWDDLNEHITVHTLEFFAIKDNKDRHDKFRKSDRLKLLNKAIYEQTHSAIADAFKAYYPIDFLCSKYSDNIWYYFTGVIWKKVDGVATLMQYIERKFVRIIINLRRRELSESKDIHDTELSSRNDNRIDMISKLLKKLGNHSTKISVIKELKTRYFNEDFETIKDTIPYLTGCRNCVIDVRSGKAITRPGKPEDYITKTTKRRYVHLSWNHPHVKMYMKYMGQVFTNNMVMNYMLRFIASLLILGNKDKIVPFLCGGGDNSKSIIVKIIESAFGSYARKISTSFLTERRTSSDGATPGLVRLRGARIVFGQEPNSRTPIQSGTLKESSGNDTVYVRDLYQKGSELIEMLISFILVIVANVAPPIPDCQKAVWRRVRMIDLNSEWLKEGVPDDIKEQYRTKKFKMDKDFDRFIPKLGNAMLWVAVQYYERYNRDGLNEPECITRSSNIYKQENNYFIGFVNDNIVRVENKQNALDKNAIVTMKDLFSEFIPWYKDRVRGKLPTITEFRKNIEAILKQKISPENTWYGYRLVEQSTGLIKF